MSGVQDTVGAAVWRWWVVMQPPPVGQTQGNRAALARMRRARTPQDVYECDPMVPLLHQSLGGYGGQRELIGALAGVIATVSADDRMAVPRRLAASHRLSPLRWGRLLAAREPDELLDRFRQLVRIMDRRANVADLAGSLFYWGDEQRGNATRGGWQYNFNTGPVALAS